MKNPKAQRALPAWASPNFNQPMKGSGSPVKMPKMTKNNKRNVFTSISSGTGATMPIKVK